MKGLIFNVKRYSVHDGPGIRVTFFLKGCPLACWWCHNPEGISPVQESVVNNRKVGDKVFRVVEEAGKYYSVGEVLTILERERVFFQHSQGGVTFSGGEPLMQHGFLEEILRACKTGGFHTAVDTSGYTPSEYLMKIIPFTDLFLYDIKHLDDQKHIEFTGVSNTGIIDNLKIVIESGKKVLLRIPVIPDKNDDPEHLARLKQFISGIRSDNLSGINLLPYHRTGLSKYSRFNIPYRMNDTRQPSKERMAGLKEYFSDLGVSVKIGG